MSSCVRPSLPSTMSRYHCHMLDQTRVQADKECKITQLSGAKNKNFKNLLQGLKLDK